MRDAAVVEGDEAAVAAEDRRGEVLPRQVGVGGKPSDAELLAAQVHGAARRAFGHRDDAVAELGLPLGVAHLPVAVDAECHVAGGEAREGRRLAPGRHVGGEVAGPQPVVQVRVDVGDVGLGR